MTTFITIGTHCIPINKITEFDLDDMIGKDYPRIIVRCGGSASLIEYEDENAAKVAFNNLVLVMQEHGHTFKNCNV